MTITHHPSGVSFCDDCNTRLVLMSDDCPECSGSDCDRCGGTGAIRDLHECLISVKITRAIGNDLTVIANNWDDCWDTILAVRDNESGEVGWEIADAIGMELPRPRGDDANVGRGFALVPAVSALLAEIVKTAEEEN